MAATRYISPSLKRLAMKTLILQLVLLSLSALAQKPTKLATDYKATRDLINASAEAYIAVFTSLGPADAGSPGESVYAEAQLSLIRAIKGSNEAKVVSSTLNVTTFPPELKEELPKLGVEYIAVGKPGKNRFVIAKLLEASEENVKLVSDLFSKAMHEDKSHLQSATQSAMNRSPPKTFTPSVIQEPAQNKASEAKPTPLPTEEPASSTPWSIIVVLIVAVTGLLWLLLKGRS